MGEGRWVHLTQFWHNTLCAIAEIYAGSLSWLRERATDGLIGFQVNYYPTGAAWNPDHSQCGFALVEVDFVSFQHSRRSSTRGHLETKSAPPNLCFLSCPIATFITWLLFGMLLIYLANKTDLHMIFSICLCSHPSNSIELQTLSEG